VTAGEHDVLHSVWVPAFRQKIGAVPGLHTTIFTTLTHTGTPDDAAYRLQCAELCGLDHSDMVMPVRVVEPSEFTAWVALRTSGAPSGAEGTVQGKPIAEFYQNTCSPCHGQQRQGGIGLPLTPEALTQPDDFYFDTIKNGRAGTVMPAWGDAGLTDEEIRTLVEFLRTPVE
jgi:cytochrome c oxidase subunit 2